MQQSDPNSVQDAMDNDQQDIQIDCVIRTAGVRSMAIDSSSTVDLQASGTPTNVLHAMDRWLHDQAIRRTLLAAFLATLLAVLAAVVLLVTFGGAALFGLAIGPAAGIAYEFVRRRNLLHIRSVTTLGMEDRISGSSVPSIDADSGQTR